MKVLLLGAGASKCYDQSPSGVRMPIAQDFFKTFHDLEISANPWVRIGDIVNYLRDYHGTDPLDFAKCNFDIEEHHSQVEERLVRAITTANKSGIFRFHRLYMQLMFLFASVINEIQNGPISTPHLNLVSELGNEDYVITFNWDTLMDRALESATNWSPDSGYCVKPKMIYENGWRKAMDPTSANAAPRLIKLHGSSNWLTSYLIIEDDALALSQDASPETFYVYQSTSVPYDTYDGRFMDGYEPFSYGYYPVNLPDPGKSAPDGRILISLKTRDAFTPAGEAGSSGLAAMPLIIPPVKNKSYSLFASLFRELWRTAEKALTDAEHIVVIGYSFPRTDVQAKSLFKNAFMKRNAVPRVTILDPSPTKPQEVFMNEFGIPNSNISIIKDYFSETFSGADLWK